VVCIIPNLGGMFNENITFFDHRFRKLLQISTDFRDFYHEGHEGHEEIFNRGLTQINADFF